MSESHTGIWAKELVTYWDPCIEGWHSYIEEFRGSTVSSSTRIVESRDKGFVLDLKLHFTIVNCFSGKFPPRFFTVKLVCFIGFPRSSYLVLFIFSAA